MPMQVSIVLFFMTLFSGIHVALGHLTIVGGIALVLTMAVALYASVMMGRSLLNIFVSDAVLCCHVVNNLAGSYNVSENPFFII